MEVERRMTRAVVEHIGFGGLVGFDCMVKVPLQVLRLK